MRPEPVCEAVPSSMDMCVTVVNFMKLQSNENKNEEVSIFFWQLQMTDWPWLLELSCMMLEHINTLLRKSDCMPSQ